MAKRLTEKQKKTIIDSFKNGETIENLSKEFKCTNSTIIRNLKNDLGETIYKEIAKKIKNSFQKNFYENANIENYETDLRLEIPKNDIKEIRNFKVSDTELNPSVSEFVEIAPVDYEMDDSSRKELSSVPISEIDFPKVVYMVVDKKIELEIKLLKDFPEWNFLPQDDLSRKAIEIFFDLNLAKRSCNKEQKVLKVPNTDVFRIASPVLIAKGISRIVCAKNLIAL